MRANNLASKFILVVFALLTASFASAQTAAAPNVVMAPSASFDVNSSETFVPGTAPFVLLIKATSNQTTVYTFTVVATMEDGSTKIVTGKVGRSDDNAGYTAASVTLGCDPVSVSTTVNEAVS